MKKNLPYPLRPILSVFHLKLDDRYTDKQFKETDKGKKVRMYNYMVLNVSKKKLFRDFLAYYKRNPEDELYYVSINNPKLLKYLEEFIERRMN